MTTIGAPASTAPRTRLSSVVLCLILTAAFVAAGTATATARLTRLQTPADMAKAYLEARYAGDWKAAWAMECWITHAATGTRSRFAEQAADQDQDLALPRHVAIQVADDIHPAQGLDSFISVTATVTSSERRDWSITGKVPLLVKDDEIRVCDGGLRLGHGIVD